MKQQIPNGAHHLEVPHDVAVTVAKVEVHLCRGDFDGAVQLIRDLRLHREVEANAQKLGTRMSIAEKLNLGVHEIGLSVRVGNALEEAGFWRVRSLVEMTPDEALGIPNFGEHSLTECQVRVQEIGLLLRNFTALSSEQIDDFNGVVRQNPHTSRFPKSTVSKEASPCQGCERS